MSSSFYDILSLPYPGTRQCLLYLLLWCGGFDLYALQYLMLAIKKKLEAKVILLLRPHLNVSEKVSVLLVVLFGHLVPRLRLFPLNRGFENGLLSVGSNVSLSITESHESSYK